MEILINATKVTETSKLEFAPNPKRQKSAAHARYAKYCKAKNWAEYEKLNEGKFLMADARYDEGRGFLKVK